MTVLFEIFDPDLTDENGMPLIKCETVGSNQFPRVVEFNIYNPITDSYLDFWFTYDMMNDLKNKVNQFMDNCPNEKLFEEYIILNHQ